jgi:predicted DNA-binding transcriptional regulator AlpA
MKHEPTKAAEPRFAEPRFAEPRFLSGWKEIASYLGRGVRTVQRYERELGFPVRRPTGKSRAAVIATKAEVDAWVAASPIRSTYGLSRPQTVSQIAMLDDMKKRVERMSELRNQMRALRAELRKSMQSLAQRVQGIHAEIDNHWLISRGRVDSSRTDVPTVEPTQNSFYSKPPSETARPRKVN